MDLAKPKTRTLFLGVGSCMDILLLLNNGSSNFRHLITPTLNCESRYTPYQITSKTNLFIWHSTVLIKVQSFKALIHT